MQYNNPYNLYVNNDHQTPNVATAPPLDDFTMNMHHLAPNYPSHSVYPNHMYIQQPNPVYIYPEIPYNIPYMTPMEQYNREMEMRKKQKEQDECCCLGLLVICCCCCMN